jgi:hypothetical protein
MAKLTDVLIGVGLTANDKKGDSLRAAFQKVNVGFTDLYTKLGLVDGSGLNLGAFEFTGSVMSTTDSSAITIDQATTITSNLTVGGDILPQTANGGDLGSSTLPWRSLYVSTNTIFIGGIPLSITDQGQLIIDGDVVTGGNANTGDITFANNKIIADPGAVFQLESKDDNDVVRAYFRLDPSNGLAEIGIDGGGDFKFEFVDDTTRLRLPPGGDIVDSTGASVLGGGGLSITDFGEGFTDSLDDGKITTSKLYNENPNQGLNNLYVLEVTDGGVVALPDGSIINGATLKTVAGNYAGITAGPASPAGKDEDSWVWVDNNGATIATKYSTDAHTWTFDNDGDLTAPGDIVVGGVDGGHLIVDGNDGDNTSVRWYNMPSNEDHSIIRTYTGNPDDETELNRGRIQLAWQDSDRSGLRIISYDRSNDGNDEEDVVTHRWTFRGDGGLELPGDIRSESAINIDINLTDSTLHRWRFGEDGDLTFPDGTVQTTAYTGGSGSSTVVRQDTAPTADNGTLWFNTVEGRLYIKYSDVWVDAAPLVQPLPDTDLDVNSITFPDATVQTSAYSDRLINNNWTVFFGEFGQLLVRNTNTEQNYFNLTPIENEDDTYGVQIGINSQGWTFLDNGTLTLPGGQQIGGSDSTQGIALTTDRGTVLFGNTPEQCVPTQSSHFHIMRDDPTTVDLFFGDDFNYVKLPYDSTLTNVGVQIGTDATNLWSFGKDGNLTVPGDILSEGNINIDINLSDSTLRRWSFGEDGNLTLPVGGDILDSNGNSVLDSGNSNIWIQEFETSLGAADVPALAMSVEYLANGDVVALIVHSEDTGGGYTGSYSSVARFNPNGTQVWSMIFKGAEFTNGWGLAVDNDSGHIYVAGWAIGEGIGAYNIATLTKLDTEDGSINWSKSYDVGYENFNTVVDVASDGSPIIVGYADSDTDNQVVTTKINAADGTVTWSRALDGQGNEEAYGMAVGPTGEVVSVGYMAQLGEDTDDQMLVVKYLSDGTIAWQKSVTVEEGYDCKGADADIDSAGNIYVCGNFYYDNNGQEFQAMIIIKFNSSGVKQWTRKLIGTCSDFATSIVVGPDNYLYLSGITVSANEETTKMVLAKYDTDGGVEWQRLLTNTTSSMFAGGFFVQLGGGSNLAVRNGYVAVGGGFGDIENFPEIQPNALVAQVDSAGTIFAVGNYEFTPSGFSGTLDADASDITVVDAAKTDSDYINEFTITDFDPEYDLTSDLIGTLYYGNVGGDDRLTNGANELVLESTGTLTLPQGGTISEGVVTSNPTIQLTPATPAVASQKLVIKGGGTFSNTENGITLTVPSNTWTEGNVDYVYVDAPTRGGQTLYWWIYPEDAGLSTPSTGTVVLDEFGEGNFTFTLTSDAYEFRVRVSPEEDNYDPANVGAESVLINSGSPTFEGEHHLHLTTGDLSVTSIFLGTDDHNVRTTTNGNIQITTPSETNQVWEFDTDGNLTIPGDIKSEGNIDIEINLSDSTLRRWTFGEDGNLNIPGDIVNSTGVSQTAQRVEGSWTVTTGTNTYNFTVPSDGTYTLWVKGNIPNGIITWNATLSITNTNVPAIGYQYAWNYTGGGSPILLTAIPDQIRGTAGTISTDATYVGSTSNRFDFTIANTSGSSVTVYYGYTKV